MIHDAISQLMIFFCKRQRDGESSNDFLSLKQSAEDANLCDTCKGDTNNYVDNDWFELTFFSRLRSCEACLGLSLDPICLHTF